MLVHDVGKWSLRTVFYLYHIPLAHCCLVTDTARDKKTRDISALRDKPMKMETLRKTVIPNGTSNIYQNWSLLEGMSGKVLLRLHKRNLRLRLWVAVSSKFK